MDYAAIGLILVVRRFGTTLTGQLRKSHAADY